MPEEKDPFEEYYSESLEKPAKAETGSEIMASLEKMTEEKNKERDVPGDAACIRGPINLFIKNMNSLIGALAKSERAKGTRVDLMVTLIVGGLAYTAANVFYLVTRNLGVKMTAELYEETFLGMFRSAIRDIGRDKGKP